MKVIIIGPSLSGKTTIVRHLRVDGNFPIEEMDEKLVEINSGVFPTDDKRKKEVFGPQIIKEILSRNSVIFFTNTDYFTVDDLKDARAKGFKIVQLSLTLNELENRNNERVKNEGYEDMAPWLQGMLRYQEEIKNTGLVDRVIDGSQSTEKIAEELTTFINTTS